MTYLERHYVRNLLLGMAGAEVVLLVAFEIVRLVSGKNLGPAQVTLSSAIALGAFLAALCASVLASAFCRMNALIDLMWTRPISRFRLALAVVGVDLAGICLAWLVSFVLLGLVPELLPGAGTLVIDRAAGQTALMVFGSLAAIYGIGIGMSYGFRMQFASFLSARGWATALLSLAVVTVFIVPIVEVARPAIRLLGGETARGPVRAVLMSPLFGFGSLSGTLATYALAFAGILVAAYGWRRVQF